MRGLETTGRHDVTPNQTAQHSNVALPNPFNDAAKSDAQPIPLGRFPDAPPRIQPGEASHVNAALQTEKEEVRP